MIWILVLLGINLVTGQLTNGDFEIGISSGPTPVPAGSTLLTGWTINTAIVVSNTPTPISGSWYVDMRATGSIQQSVSTTVGQQYILTFQYSSSDNVNTRTLTASAVGIASETHRFRKSVATDWNQGYVLFTATGTSTVIQFVATGASGSGIFLDDVQLWPVYAAANPNPTNPSFESEVCGSSSCTGVTSLTDWTVSSGSVEVATTKWAAYDGSNSIGLVQTTGGTVLRKDFTVLTDIRRMHFVTWRMSTDPSLAATLVSTMTVGQPSIGNDQRTYGRPSATASTLSGMGYMSMVYSFVPNTTSISLRIQANQAAATARGAVMDDLRVYVALMMGATPASFVETSAGPSSVTFSGSVPLTLTEGFSVKWATIDGTTSPGDITGTPTASIAGGQTSTTFQLTVDGDEVVEADETFLLIATEVYGNRVPANLAIYFTETITNDDVMGVENITAANFTVVEGDSGTVTIDVTIHLNTTSAFTTLIGYRTQSRTATEDVDYVAQDTNCLVAIGDSSCTVTITIIPDTVHEDDETFTFSVRRLDGVLLTTFVETDITIANDDIIHIASVTTPSWSVNEGDSGTTSVPVTITTTITSDSITSIGYRTVAAVADASDFNVVDLACLVPVGSTSCVANAEITGDTLHEIDEDFTFSIRRINTDTLTTFVEYNITIVNDDAPPVFSLPTTLRVQESAVSGVASISVFISTATGVETFLSFFTSDAGGFGSATDGDDYNATTGTVTWPVLTILPRTINIPLIDDEKQEEARLFNVTITAAPGSESHVTLGNSVCVVTIIPDNVCDIQPGDTACTPDDSIPEITMAFPHDNEYPVTVTLRSVPRDDLSQLGTIAYGVEMLNYFFTINAFIETSRLPTFSFTAKNPLVVTIYLNGTEIELSGSLGIFMRGEQDVIWADGTTTCGRAPHADYSENSITFYICHLTNFTLVNLPAERDPITEWAMSFSCGQNGEVVEGFFTEILGLRDANEYECEKYTDVNGRETTNCIPSQHVTSPVTVRRLLTPNDEMWEWRDLVAGGSLSNSRQNCTIILFDRQYIKARQYTLINAWPSSVSIELQVGCSEVDFLTSDRTCKGKRAVVEETVIIHEGLTEGGTPVGFSILAP